MSYQNGTTHYNLPQTVGSDKRDWSDTNAAFAAIDAAIYQASSDASAASSAASDAQADADAAALAATNAQADADAAQTAATTAGELAQTAKSRADSAYTLAQGKAGKEVELASVTATSSDTFATLMERIRATVWLNREENLALYIINQSRGEARVAYKSVVNSITEQSVGFTNTILSSNRVTAYEFIFRTSNTYLEAFIEAGGVLVNNYSANSASGYTLTLVKLAK